MNSSLKYVQLKETYPGVYAGPLSMYSWRKPTQGRRQVPEVHKGEGNLPRGVGRSMKYVQLKETYPGVHMSLKYIQLKKTYPGV